MSSKHTRENDKQAPWNVRKKRKYFVNGSYNSTLSFTRGNDLNPQKIFRDGEGNILTEGFESGVLSNESIRIEDVNVTP